MARNHTANTDEEDFGALSTLEGVAKASCSYWIHPDFAASASDARIIGQWASSFSGIWLFNRVAETSAVRCIILDGVNHFGDTPILTDAVWQHHHWAFDGTQTDPDTPTQNAKRLGFWLNGAKQTLIYGGPEIPAALGATAANLQIGVQQAASSSMRMRIGEAYQWNQAINEQVAIDSTKKGCPPRSGLVFDAGLFGDDSPEPDRSVSGLSGVLTGTAKIAHPPDVIDRGSCGGSHIMLAGVG